MTTLRDKYVGGLKRLGAVPVASRSTRYLVYRLGDDFFYVGRSGSLRSGFTVNGSYPVTSKTKRLIIEAWQGETGLPES